jgi:hypothetical protein
LHVLEDVGEKAADILRKASETSSHRNKTVVRTLSDSHVSDDPLDGILPFVTILAIKVGTKLKVLACSMVNSDDIEDTQKPNLSWAQPWKKRSCQ